MGKKIRVRKKVQFAPNAHLRRAAKRYVESRQSKHRRTPQILLFTGRLFINKEMIDDGYIVIT